MSDFDPTTNRIPFGLLTPEEQTALKRWPHDWQYYMLEEWRFIVTPSWECGVVYRGKPAPVVATTWLPIYGNGQVGFDYKSHEEAINAANRKLLIGILRLDITDGVASTTIEELQK